MAAARIDGRTRYWQPVADALRILCEPRQVALLGLAALGVSVLIFDPRFSAAIVAMLAGRVP